MSSKTHHIKSKKQKLAEIRNEKQRSYDRPHYSSNNKNTRVEVVIDSETPDSASVQLVETKHNNVENGKKEGQGSGVKEEVKSTQKFNDFNFDRVRKFMKVQFKPPALNVQECLSGIEAAQSNRVISYKQIGIATKKTVCQNYLKTRLENIPEQTAPTNTVSLEVTEDNKPKQNNEEQAKATEQVQVKKRRRAPRYFDDELSEDSEEKGSEVDDDDQNTKKTVKCYRCGQKGHIARLCNQRQIIKCVYCLGPHHNSECTDKLCHRCNQKGHIKQNCNSDKIQCRRCRMIGHVVKNCGKVLMMNFSADREREIRERYDKEDLEKLKCLKCNGLKNSKGHFNCHEYGRKIPKIYDEPYIIL